jgi:cell division FtsZ-interacting protein ZapD
MTRSRVLFDQGTQRTTDILLTESVQPHTDALQIVVSHVRESGQAHPVTAVIGAQQRRIGVDKLDRLDDPGVYQAQRQSDSKADEKGQMAEAEICHGSPSK